MLEDVVDRVDKSHVEHLVGLVEHDGIDIVEVYHPAVDEVDESARCGDDDLHAAAQGSYLALDARAAVDGQYVHVGHVFGKVGQVAGNLQAELAGGCEHECLGHVARCVDALDYGQPEGGRLAGAGLCEGHHVALARQQARYHRLLHGHGLLEAHIGDAAQQVVAHAQFFKVLHMLYISDTKITNLRQ